MSKVNKRLIHEVGLDNNLKDYIVKLIVESQFKALKEIIEKGEYESVRLMHLGVFKVNPNRLKKIKENAQRIQSNNRDVQRGQGGEPSSDKE